MMSNIIKKYFQLSLEIKKFKKNNINYTLNHVEKKCSSQRII